MSMLEGCLFKVTKMKDKRKEGNRVSQVGVLILGFENSREAVSPTQTPTRLPAGCSFIISVDKTEAHGPGLAMETHTSDKSCSCNPLAVPKETLQWKKTDLT